ncbi:hypothetical protein SEA_RIKSENGUPTA_79 [Microbacterium phage RikSengupta]|nr:hypothetical protein SEA_RIKSENGUPTA_79 [Microbacterium phage RikSengupta]
MNDEEEDYVESPYAAEMQRRREYTQDGLSASESHKPMANVIWQASHADEGTISATGADIVAKALIMAGYGKIATERPQEPSALPSYQWRVVGVGWGGDRMGSELAMRHYARTHGGELQRRNTEWETVPLVAPKPAPDPEPELWKISPGSIMQIPEPETDWDDVERVLYAWELRDNGPSHFSRGLHLLAHLKRGGTLEEYGMPR